MTELAAPDAYGTLIEPATFKVERVLPGPIDRVWAYLTDSNLRRQWLASGDMQPKTGSVFELTWRNDELATLPGKRPQGMSAEHSMESRILAYDPPHTLAFTWGDRGEVSFELAQAGADVRLTLIHRRISDRRNMLMVGAGWHMHLDVLAAVTTGRTIEPFWQGWERLRAEYDQRLPA